MNHLTDNAPDADYYSQITAFLGVLFGVGVPVGFQVITSFGERYNNAYLSKLVFDEIKTDLIFYIFYTLMTIFAGILFSYLRRSSLLAFLDIIFLGILSFYYAVRIIKIIFSTIVDSEDFANKLVIKKSQKVQNNNYSIEAKRCEFEKLAGVNYDLLYFQLKNGNSVNFEVGLRGYLKDFNDFIVKYEMRSNDLRSFFENIKPKMLNKEKYKIRMLILRDIFIKSNTDKLFSELEIIGMFFDCLIKDIKNEKEMERFIHIIEQVYSRYLDTFMGKNWNNKFIIMTNWVIYYYFSEKVIISEESKNYLLTLMYFQADRFFKNNPEIDDVKKFMQEILSNSGEKYHYDSISSITVKQGYVANNKISIKEIDNIYNRETFALDFDEYDELTNAMENISNVQKDYVIKKKIKEYQDSAYEQHKRYLMGCLLFKVIAECLYLEKNEYVKEILKSHDEHVKRGYKRFLPNNHDEASEMSHSCEQLDSDYLLGSERYNYDAVVELFKDKNELPL